MSAPLLYCNLGLISYPEALALQVALQEHRINRRIPDVLLLLQHPPTYTLGKSGRGENIIWSETMLHQRGIAVIRTDRGGDVTGHNPGQLVAYPIIDLHLLHLSLPRYVFLLEEAIRLTLADLGINASRKEGFPGLWVETKKIASLGVHQTRWVTKHGLALNIHNDLSFFQGIIPCGIQGCELTSIRELTGEDFSLDTAASLLLKHFAVLFNVQVEPIDLMTLFERARAAH